MGCWKGKAGLVAFLAVVDISRRVMSFVAVPHTGERRGHAIERSDIGM